jgi:UDP-N-acetylmuramoylalanine--D-glutamate ligase
MLYALREYKGEPHRVELVSTIGEVEYFDDSKGTNVGATVAALYGLGVERRIVIILGGIGKGQDFTPLAQPIAQFARAVVLIGRDAAIIETAIKPALSDAQVQLIHTHSMSDAVSQARQCAQPGDAVLLSPACSSFDMFRDYAHRAEEFRRAVETFVPGAVSSNPELHAQLPQQQSQPTQPTQPTQTLSAQLPDHITQSSVTAALSPAQSQKEGLS